MIIKQLKIIILLGMILLFASCADDSRYSQKDIVGSWEWVETKAGEVRTNKIQQGLDSIITNFISEYYHDNTTGVMKFTFNDDGTFVRYSQNETRSGTYSIRGDKLTMIMNGKSEVVRVSFSEDGFSVYVDQTEYYQDISPIFMSGVDDVNILKVLEEFTYKRVE